MKETTSEKSKTPTFNKWTVALIYEGVISSESVINAFKEKRKLERQQKINDFEISN